MMQEFQSIGVGGQHPELKGNQALTLTWGRYKNAPPPSWGYQTQEWDLAGQSYLTQWIFEIYDISTKQSYSTLGTFNPKI